MKKKHIQEFVQSYLKENINKDDITIDATIGNGHDTAILAELSKFVYGFDIQELALVNTTNLLKEKGLSNYELINDSHENILNYIKDFKCIVFNLGYLPNSDKKITTTKKTTLKTLKSLTSYLKQNQFIIITCYPGHQEGKMEADAVLDFVGKLNSSFSVSKYELINKDNKPPFVVIIEKG